MIVDTYMKNFWDFNILYIITWRTSKSSVHILRVISNNQVEWWYHDLEKSERLYRSKLTDLRTDTAVTAITTALFAVFTASSRVTKSFFSSLLVSRSADIKQQLAVRLARKTQQKPIFVCNWCQKKGASSNAKEKWQNSHENKICISILKFFTC